jgi:hypothetical protein
MHLIVRRQLVRLHKCTGFKKRCGRFGISGSKIRKPMLGDSATAASGSASSAATSAATAQARQKHLQQCLSVVEGKLCMTFGSDKKMLNQTNAFR